MVDGKKRGGTPPRERGLADFCQYLKGVGPARAVKLANLGIENVNDLLTHYPRKYYDRRRLVGISSLQVGVEDTFVGRVMTAAQRSPRRRKTLVTAAIGDDTGIVQVVWFNQPYLLQHLKPGTEVIVSGPVRMYRGQRQLVNPEFEIVGEELDDSLISGGRIVPVYGLTSGVTQRFLRQLIRRTIEEFREAVVENLPSSLTRAKELVSRHDAIVSMHFPDDEDALERARTRIKTEELFYMQLVLSLQRRYRATHHTRTRIDIPFELEQRFLGDLGFDLTQAQRRVLDEIHVDLASDRGMNRLLQGDVGSGKTVVAGATLLAGVEAGHQAAMMVPTEILALQHHNTLSPFFERMGIRSEVLIGSLKAAQKRRIHEGLADGTIQVAIGTHALIQSDVRFKRLAVVVIDEQHRFGVRQRAALVREGHTPHMLVMTATPIPRTLALTAYADLDLSVIDEMPASRMGIKTHIVHPSRREGMYRYIREQQEEGAQTYLLYPVIEETEKLDLEAAETAFAELSKGPFKGVNVGMLHGRMNMEDKSRMMQAFSSGDIRVLVATTVVEVGVHVPAATIMVIHHPERFGLSQLHQLRGRVGRGGREGFCFLVAGDHLAPESMERLDVLVNEHDGFRIAEEDLRLRGPGEFLGVRQHGVPGFKVANPLRDGKIVERVNVCVRDLLEKDPLLRSSDGQLCRRHLRAIISDDVGLRAVV